MKRAYKYLSLTGLSVLLCLFLAIPADAQRGGGHPRGGGGGGAAGQGQRAEQGGGGSQGGSWAGESLHGGGGSLWSVVGRSGWATLLTVPQGPGPRKQLVDRPVLAAASRTKHVGLWRAHGNPGRGLRPRERQS